MTPIKAEFRGGPLDGQTRWVPGGHAVRSRMEFAKVEKINLTASLNHGPIPKPDFDVEVYELDLLASNYAVYYHQSCTFHLRPSQHYRYAGLSDPLLLWFAIKEREFQDALPNPHHWNALSIARVETIDAILNSKAGRSARRRRLRKPQSGH